MIDARGGITLGMKVGWARLRGLGAPLTLVLACSAVYALGVLGRRVDPTEAVDNLLSVPVFGFALPVLAYLISERVCGGQRLDRGVDSLARHGTDRRAAVLGLLLASALCTALTALLLTLSAVLRHMTRARCCSICAPVSASPCWAARCMRCGSAPLRCSANAGAAASGR